MKNIHKNEAGFSVIDGLIVAVVVIVLSVIGWLTYSHLAVPHTTEATPQETLHDISAAISKKFHTSSVADATQSTPTKQGDINYSNSGEGQGSETWKIPDNDFYVDLTASSTTYAYYASSSDPLNTPIHIPSAKKLYSIIDTELHLDSLSRAPANTTVDDTNNNDASPSAIYAYQNNKTYCTVLFSGDNNQYVTVACDSAFEATSQTNTVKPFAAVYLAANPTLSDKILFDNTSGIDYEKSKTPGYSLANIQIENPFDSASGVQTTTSAAAYFYKKASGTWQYISVNYGLGDGLGDVIACELFPKNNQDAYLAYKGQDCTHNDTAQSSGTL